MSTAALEVDDVAIDFGGVQAVGGVSFAVQPGEIVGLIGPNGAGKTTLLRIIAGILSPDRGRILLSGAEVTHRPTAARVRRGLAITHQIVRPFRSMTALDNVTLAAGHRATANPLTALFRLDRRAEEARAAAILAEVGLGQIGHTPVAALPLGRLKRLEVARALAVEPSVMLLDEPLAGLNHTEAAQQADTIAAVAARGITTILVEHNLAEVIRITRRLIVLDGGKIIADGPPDEVMAQPAVREAYLGGPGDRDAAA
jgi:branched-chain amino acid transport system ATP-binding protein